MAGPGHSVRQWELDQGTGNARLGHGTNQHATELGLGTDSVGGCVGPPLWNCNLRWFAWELGFQAEPCMTSNTCQYWGSVQAGLVQAAAPASTHMKYGGGSGHDIYHSYTSWDKEGSL